MATSGKLGAAVAENLMAIDAKNKGHPLYFYIQDVKNADPGDAYGEALKMAASGTCSRHQARRSTFPKPFAAGGADSTAVHKRACAERRGRGAGGGKDWRAGGVLFLDTVVCTRWRRGRFSCSRFTESHLRSRRSRY